LRAYARVWCSLRGGAQRIATHSHDLASNCVYLDCSESNDDKHNRSSVLSAAVSFGEFEKWRPSLELNQDKKRFPASALPFRLRATSRVPNTVQKSLLRFNYIWLALNVNKCSCPVRQCAQLE
jgi:hypothetical protein